MKDQEFTNDEFNRLVEQIVPMPFVKEGEEMSLRIENIVLKKRDEMGSRWDEEITRWGEPNKWLAFNAVQGAEQHLVNAKGKSEDARVSASLERAINGRTPLADRALELLNV